MVTVKIFKYIDPFYPNYNISDFPGSPVGEDSTLRIQGYQFNPSGETRSYILHGQTNKQKYLVIKSLTANPYLLRSFLRQITGFCLLLLPLYLSTFQFKLMLMGAGG